MGEDYLEAVEVEEASWEDWEDQLSLIIPTRIHSEPQRAQALSLETHHRKAAAYLVELPARLLVAQERSLLSPPSLGREQVWRSYQWREIFNSIINKNLENYQAADFPQEEMWDLLASLSSNKVLQLNQQLLVEHQASEVILENIGKYLV